MPILMTLSRTGLIFSYRVLKSVVRAANKGGPNMPTSAPKTLLSSVHIPIIISPNAELISGGFLIRSAISLRPCVIIGTTINRAALKIPQSVFKNTCPPSLTSLAAWPCFPKNFLNTSRIFLTKVSRPALGSVRTSKKNCLKTPLTCPIIMVNFLGSNSPCRPLNIFSTPGKSLTNILPTSIPLR